MSRTLERNPGIRDSVTLGMSIRRPWLPATLVGALHYLFTIADETAATEFFTQLATGENLPGTSAIYTLRERLIAEHYDGGLNQRVKLAFVVMAWNAYRKGVTVKLAWTPGGSSPDKFPAIDGLAEQEASA